MANRAKIVDRDHGYKAMVSRMQRLRQRKPKVEVGVLGDAASEKHRGGPEEGAVTLAMVASWNEFGVGVPERSFIRAWFDEFLSKNKALLRTVMRKVLEGKLTERQGMELLGVQFQADVQHRIGRGVPPPNAESTIERKGSAFPLIDKGQLLQGITYRVVNA